MIPHCSSHAIILKESTKDLEQAALSTEEPRVQATLKSSKISFTYTTDKCYPWRWLVMCFLELRRGERGSERQVKRPERADLNMHAKISY